MIHPYLASRGDILQWAGQRTAQHELPRLMRLLAHATLPTPEQIAFRTDEGVQLSGWDGLVETEVGRAPIPDGVSGWELSTEQSPKPKAEKDYATRTDDPLGVDPKTSTFIFVTPRSWGGKDAWAQEKLAESDWHGVRAYDVDDLLGWLEQAPPVHLWFTELIGKDAKGMRTLDSYWADWTRATEPPLTTDVVLAGRHSAVGQIHEWLEGDGAVLTIKGDSQPEAVAFFIAAVQELPVDARDHVAASLIVIDDADAWARAIASSHHLTLIPLSDAVDVTQAVRNGHRVVIPALTANVVARGQVIELPRPQRRALEEGLRELGLPEGSVQELATMGRRSPLTLRRRLAIAPSLERPSWAAPAESRALVGPLLAGKWDESSDADREALARLANSTYDDVAAAVARWASESDPPIRRIGTTWFITSREDAWALLSPFLTAEDLQRFSEVVHEVLGTPLPSMELPLDQRWMAAVLGKPPRWSPELSEGLADMVALIGARAQDTIIANGRTGSAFASHIVHELLQGANRDQSGDLWNSLAVAGVLRLLAEAAPDAFLTALEDAADGADPVVLAMFTDHGAVDTMTSSSGHTELLWALETLAWSPDHVGRVCVLLARLARLDPGGRWSNRPASSLRQILLPMYPQTTATVEDRLSILDAVRRAEPAVSWDLMVGLLPERQGIVMPSSGPRWRDWKPNEATVLVDERNQNVDGIVARIAEDVGVDGARWAAVIEKLDVLPSTNFEAIVSDLEAIDPDAFAVHDCDTILSALRSLVSHHRRYSTAGWAMPPEPVDRLAQIYDSLYDDTHALTQHADLFSHHPSLVDADETDWPAYNAAAEAARVEAARAILGRGGLDDILELAQHVEVPHLAGSALAAADLTDEQERAVLATLESPDQPSRLLARGYVTARASDPDWTSQIIAEQLPEWDTGQQAQFMLALASTPRTFAQVEELGEAVETAYWSQFWPVALADPTGCEHAVTKLVEIGRPHVALDLLGMYVDRREPPIDSSLILASLHQAAQAWPEEAGPVTGRLSYEIPRLFEFLDTQDVDEAEIAALEFFYLPFLERSDRSPRLLHRRLAENPAFFVEAVSIVYRGEGEDPKEVAEEEQARIRQVWRLLESWHQPPGITDSGEIDDQALRRWTTEARAGFSAANRQAIGDQMIGKALGLIKGLEEDVWPPPDVRDLVEELASLEVETGMEIAVFGSRGFVTRSLDEGGTQERALEQRYRSLADDAKNKWPRCGAMLARIADSYAAQARHEDERAEKDEDFWR